MENLDPYELISEHCTVPQITALLRDAKQIAKRDILIGTTKEDAIQNLRRGVDARYIQQSEVWNLLRSSEENGDQHIFLYKPKTSTLGKQLGEAAKVATKFCGEKWESRLPRFGIPEKEYAWSDFRIEVGGWTGKLYGWYTSRKKYRAPYTKKIENGLTIEVYEFEMKRIRQVCLAKWDGLTLQMRVPRCDSRARLRRTLQTVWDKLAEGGFNRGDFAPLDLRKAKRAIIDATIDDSNELEAIDIRVTDDEGVAEFKPLGPGYPMSPAAKKALQTSHKLAECRDLLVHFFPVDDLFDNTLKAEIIGQDDHNEIVFAAKTSPEAVTYVLGVIHRLGH